MTHAGGPRAIVFDVVGTLFSLDGLKEPFARTGLPEHALDLWLSELLRDGFALAAAGSHVPFIDVAFESLASLRARHGLDPDSDCVAAVTQRFSMLPPYPDARDALDRLRAAGLTAICLSNGSAAATEELLGRADIETLVGAVVSVDQAGRWKPHPDPYRLAIEAAGGDGEDVVMVSAHAWDLHGAAAAGLRTAWVRRRDGYPATLHPPDVIGDSLPDVLDQLLATRAARGA